MSPRRTSTKSRRNEVEDSLDRAYQSRRDKADAAIREAVRRDELRRLARATLSSELRAALERDRAQRARRARYLDTKPKVRLNTRKKLQAKRDHDREVFQEAIQKRRGRRSRGPSHSRA